MSIRPFRRPGVSCAVPSILLALAGSTTALAAGPFGASLNLSSLNGTNGFATNGINAGDVSGGSVSSAGDVNGDGIDDIIIGAPYADPGGTYAAGASYVVFGTTPPFAASFDLSALDGTNGFVMSGIDASDRSGASVSSAGDVNGDGIDDLIIGAYFADPNGQATAGESYIVFGTTPPFAASLTLSTLTGTNGFVITGIDASDFSGRSVSSAGDVNGDGYDDLIIGAQSADPNGQSVAGESYVVFGGPGVGAGGSLNLSTLNGANGFVVSGIDAYDRSGASVSSAGDVNGDGIGDLIIGAWGGDPNGQTYAGESYVVFGTTTPFAASLNLSTLDGTNGFVCNGIDAGDHSGWSVSSAGDVNGDGIGDLIIGAYQADPNGQPGAGESYVVFGKPTPFAASLNLSTLDGTNGFVMSGIDAGDLSGVSVSSAGDANGDGYDDLIIGATYADPNGQSFAGESYVVFGKPTPFAASLNLSTLDGTNGFVVNGFDANDRSGRSVSSAGDVNVDGIDDLIIGAFFADAGGTSSAGQSYVVFGRPSQVWTSPAGGAWDTGAKWLSGIAPTRGITVIDTPIGITVTGPADPVFLDRLTLGAAAGRTTLTLVPNSIVSVERPLAIPTSAAVTGAGTLACDAAITLDGHLTPDGMTVIANGGLSIGAPGVMDVTDAFFAGDLACDGRITLQTFGPLGAPKELDVFGALSTSEDGSVLVHGAAILDATTGFANSGIASFSIADATVYGDVTNVGVPSGNGFTPLGAISVVQDSFVLFADDVANQSQITVDSSSSVVILGTLTGNGVAGPGGIGTAGPVFLGSGVSPGFSAAVAHFDGDATLGGAAVTTIEIGGTTPGVNLDQVSVAGVFGAGGTLRITVMPGYVPQGPASYKVLDFGSVIGSFSVIDLDPILVSRNADTSTVLIDGTIRIPAPSCAGDITGDGFTNSADFNVLASNFGASVTPNTGGDLTGDGLVNSADFNVLAGDFGCGS